MTIALAAKERRKIITMDVETAYLNAKMTDDLPVYMKIDPLISAILTQLDKTYRTFTDSSRAVTVKLDRALYGCVQSAVLWYKDLKATLEEADYIMNPYDICVFNKKYDGEQVTVIFHVDDLLGSSILEEALEELYNILIKKYKRVKVTRGTTHAYLGMVLHLPGDGTATISMPTFISNLIKESGVKGTAITPADEYLFSLRSSPPLSERQSKIFHTLTAKLAYLAQHARPDILTLTSFLTSRVQGPTEDDQTKLARGIKYLNGSKDLVLTIGGTDPIKVTAYVGASFAIHNTDMRSHTGVYITLGAGAIYCKSSKQKIMTKSSTEAELVAISDALPQIVWMKHFLEAQGYNPEPAHIWEDNMSTICLAKTGRKCSERSRHIQIRYFWIYDYLTNGEVTIQHLHTDKMIADHFTKPLQGAKFKLFRSLCLNII